VWTDKGSRILKMSTELKAGVVWANTYNKFDPTSPFGGYKESGFGREGGRQAPQRLEPARPGQSVVAPIIVSGNTVGRAHQ
jgi:acyl-CoA reductase-like NAD-dependent aldehyde dehydrogenase